MLGDSYYLRARFYMPGPAMFTSLDPYFGDTGEPQSLHKYAYVHGDPVNAWDPTGMFLGLSTEFVNSISMRLILFSLRHPRLIGVIGFITNLLLPSEFHDAMLASGFPPFQAFGGAGRVGKGFLRILNLQKTGAFRSFVRKLGKSFEGKYYNEYGHAFEEFFSKALKGAERGVQVLNGRKFNADYVTSGYVIEIKTGAVNMHQLRAIAEYANGGGRSDGQRRTLVYIFLQRPDQKVIDAIERVGGTILHYFD